MKSRILGSTVGRILRQLRHDHRTIALLLVSPTFFLAIVYFMFDGQEQAFDRIALIMLGIFPFMLMFMMTSIAMLRERSSGTLERLMTTPAGRADLLFGYGIAFGIAATVQAGAATTSAYLLFGLRTPGSALLVLFITVANAVLGVALGLLCSAFARTELQALQFMPLIITPQVLLCGLFVARNEMAGWLEAVSDVLPLTYAVEALQEVGAHTQVTGVIWRDLGVVLGAVLLALVLAAATLPRRTP